MFLESFSDFLFFLNLTTAKQTYSKIDYTVIEYRFVFHSTILNKNFRCLSFLKCLFPFDEMAHSGKGCKLACMDTYCISKCK